MAAYLQSAQALVERAAAAAAANKELAAQVGLYMLAAAGFLSLVTLLLPWSLTFLTYRPQSLKARYGAQWALVTGGSSGIGLSLCRKLAAQGLNIVMAAYPDALLQSSGEALRAEFPGIQVRIVPVDLGASDARVYMAPLEEATRDITVQIIFNNAGYMVTAFFEDTELSRVLANHNCNVTSALVITHHFLRKLRDGGLKGAICFTSSPANLLPSPFSCMYGATKAAVTHFASSLAVEVKPEGIDVCVAHPSPVATNFYNGAAALAALAMFKKTATGPDHVADVILRGVGRSTYIDQGYYPITFKLLLRLIDISFLAELMPRIATTVGDYRFLKEKQRQQRAQRLMEQQKALADAARQESQAAAAAAKAVQQKEQAAASSSSEEEEEEQQQQPAKKAAAGMKGREAATATPASSKKRAPSSSAKKRL